MLITKNTLNSTASKPIDSRTKIEMMKKDDKAKE
jgi:hypothetical protein